VSSPSHRSLRETHINPAVRRIRLFHSTSPRSHNGKDTTFTINLDSFRSDYSASFHLRLLREKKHEREQKLHLMVHYTPDSPWMQLVNPYISAQSNSLGFRSRFEQWITRAETHGPTISRIPVRFLVILKWQHNAIWIRTMSQCCSNRSIAKPFTCTESKP